MLQITRANLEYFCCICMEDIRPNVYTEKVYELCLESDLIRRLHLTSHISVLRNPRNISQIKQYCKKICTLCYNKVGFALEIRDKILTACIVLKEIVEADGVDTNMIERLKWFCRICLRRQQNQTNQIPVTLDIVTLVKQCTGVRYSSYKDSAVLRLKEGTNITELLDVDDKRFPKLICKFCLKNLTNMDELRKQATTSFDDMQAIIGVIDTPKACVPQIETLDVPSFEDKDVTNTNIKIEPDEIYSNERVLDTNFENSKESFISVEPLKIEDYTNNEDKESESDQSVDDPMDQDYSLNDERDEDSESDHAVENSIEENTDLDDAIDQNTNIEDAIEKNIEIKRHTCPICSKNFRCKKSFELHTQVHHDILVAENDGCKSPKVRRKVKINRSKEKKFRFKEKKNISKVKKDASKVKKDTSKLKKDASKVNKDTPKVKKDTSEVKKDTPEQKKSWKCEVCLKRFRSEKLYDIHNKYEHDEGKNDKQHYKCEFCTKSYCSNGSLLRHQRESHPNDKITVATDDTKYFQQIQNSCHICGRHFKAKYHLRNHILVVHEKQKRFKCAYCDVTFSNSSNRGKHEERHTNPISFTCDVCGRNFSRANKLKVHMEVHNTDPELLCKVCRRSQPSKEALAEHLKKHEDKFLQCPFCGKLFKNHSHCIDHQNAVHLGLKPFKCSHCERCFGDRKTRANHEKQHTEDRPYQCFICKMGFKAMYSLNKHKKEMMHYADGEQVPDKSSAKKSSKGGNKKVKIETLFGNHFLLDYTVESD